MSGVNYQMEMARIMQDTRPGTGLLLHSCCGPCSSAVLEQLATHFSIVLLYYNPNIWPQEEYDRRLCAQREIIARLPVAYPVTLVESPYNHWDFLEVSAGMEAELEGGARCTACFALRLDEAAREAAARGLPWFTTTLSVSPHKNAPLLNKLGAEVAERYGVGFLCADFKKKEGYKRSTQLAQEYGLYRQEYCGCEFSLKERQRLE